MYRLAIEDHAGNRTVVPVARDEVTIGRRVGSTIRLTDRNVSRNHAKLNVEGGGVWLTDESRYGVQVNNRKVHGRLELAWGDRLRVGDYLLTLIAEGPASTDDQGEALELSSTVDDVGGAPPAAAAESPPEDHGTFVVSSGGGETQEVSLEGDELALGRAEDNDIIIDDESVSSRHARMRWLGDRWEISSLHPEHGILVNGLGVEDAVLCDGDVVLVGAVSLRFLGADSETLVPTLRSRVEPEAAEGTGRPFIVVAGVLLVGAIVLLWSTIPEIPHGPPPEVTPTAPSASQGLPPAAPAPIPPAVPPPPSRAAQLAELTNLAVEAMALRDWTAAIAVLGRGADRGLTSPKAEAMFARAQVEQLNEARLGDAKARLAAKDFDQATLALRAVAPGSAYGVEVQDLSRRIQAAKERRTSVRARRPAAPQPPAGRPAAAPRAVATPKVSRSAPPAIPATPAPSPNPAPPAKRAERAPPAPEKAAPAPARSSTADRRAEARRLFTAGRRLHTQGRSDDAEVELRKAAAMAPGFAEPHLVLGLIYTRAGRKPEAARSFGRFLQLAPQDKRRPMVEKMLRQVK